MQAQVEQLFRLASQNFEANNYVEGLNQITSCISLLPQNSSLYSNRALFHSQLGNIDSAVQDLTHAIDYNHQNYVAYFNLFSLQYNSGDIILSFENLCCSLSCLYLLRARKAKKQLDVQRAIKYAENNVEAHILKSLMYLEDGKHKLALNEIEWALDVQPSNEVCVKIKNIVNRKLNPYAVSDIAESSLEELSNFRLHSSYEPSNELEEEIKLRVKEFNQIYDELINSEYGTVTQKVPRLKLDNQNSHLNQQNSRNVSGLSEIYQIKYRDVYNNHEIINYSRQKHSEATKEHLPNEVDQSQLLLGNNQKEENSLLLKLDEIKGQQDNKQGGISINMNEQNLLDDDSLTKQQKPILVGLDSFEEDLLKEQDSSYNVQNANLRKAQQSQYLLLDDHVPTQIKPNLASITPLSNVSEVSSKSESVSIYPIRDKKRLQFTIISAELKNATSVKDVYLMGNYNSRKGQRLKTPNKKIEEKVVRWFTVISPTPISETKQTVNAKVYSKQYFNYNDDLIGEGEIEIIRSGELKFPLYLKNKVTGFVSLRVDLL